MVVNPHFVFTDVAGPLTIGQRFRFWRYQAFELFRMAVSAVRRRRVDDLREIRGRLAGIRHIAATTLREHQKTTSR